MSELITARPQAIYDEALANGSLSSDDGQAVVVKALDSLFDKVQKRQPKASFWQKLFHQNTQMPSQKGLYLYGGVGRGKSLLMDMFYDCLPKGMARRVHFHDFMVLAHDKMNEARQKGARDAVSEAAKELSQDISLLCFDEMEVRDIADAMIIKRLFDGLFANGIMVVATSNRHPEALYKGGLHRDRFVPFITKLMQECDVLEIAEGQDWRARLLGTSPRWYVPCNAANEAKMTAQFALVTNESELTPLTVKVAGRELCFHTHAHNIIFTSFDSLCAVPLAARDYIALADRVTGLFLTDIPLLDDAKQNEARRFMWLIDALYDRGRFLVAKAEIDMDQLYQGRQWAFEFDRTLSRLAEMSRISYGE